MKRDNRIVIALIVVLIVGLLFTLYFFYIRPYTPKYKWTASYYYNDDEPYGTEILYKSLKASHKKADFNLINKSFDKQFKWEGTNNCYIFIGNNYRLTESESDRLFSFIEKGNVAFICTEDLNWNTVRKIFPEKETDNEKIETATDSLNDEESEEVYFIDYNSYKKRVKVHFIDSLQTTHAYSFHYQYLKDTMEYYFFSLHPELIDKEKYTYKPISYIDSIQNLNYISVKYGKGELYLHANPIFFTNYFLATVNGYNHANEALAFVGKRKIYWDEINKTQDYNLDDNYFNYSGERSPFRYLLSQKSFRWAWYLLLTTIALFLIFGSKRRQKAIPLMGADKNSSLDYVKAVASLYYQPRSHSAITEEMWHLFCVFVKTKYGIDFKNDEKQQMEALSKASKVDLRTIKKIVKLKNEIIYMFDGSKNAKLNTLQQLLEEFYKKTK